MKLVTCSAKVAATRHDDSGVRRVRIYKGTARERIVEIDRAGLKFTEPLPPEILADAELVITDAQTSKPARKAIEEKAAAEVGAMEYPDLVKLATELGIKATGKKETLRANVIAKLADLEKAKTSGSPGGAASNLREATAEETAQILEAEGVKPGDELELADGLKVRVVSMDDAVVVEPLEA